MHYSTHYHTGGNVWGETFSGQKFAQLAYLHGQNTTVLFDDVPQVNGQLSNALKQQLADEGLLDMEAGNPQVQRQPHAVCPGGPEFQGEHSAAKQGTRAL